VALLKQQPSEKKLRHPADGEAWKDFDKEFPEFAGDARLDYALLLMGSILFQRKTQNTTCGPCLL